MTRNLYSYFSTILMKISVLVVPCMFPHTHIVQIIIKVQMNLRSWRRKSSFMVVLLHWSCLFPLLVCNDTCWEKTIKLNPFISTWFIDSLICIIQSFSLCTISTKHKYCMTWQMLWREESFLLSSVWRGVNTWVCVKVFQRRRAKEKSIF